MAFTAIALAVLLAAEPPAGVPALVISELTEQHVLDAATALGWKIGESDRTTDGGFYRTLILPSGAPINVYGLDCEGQPVRCGSYYMRLTFGVGDTKRVDKANAELKYLYAQVSVNGPTSFEIYRAEFLSGGITRKHLEISLETFAITADEVAAKVFPCGIPVDGREPECEANKEYHH